MPSSLNTCHTKKSSDFGINCDFCIMACIDFSALSKDKDSSEFQFILCFFSFFLVFKQLITFFLSYIPYDTAKSHDKRNFSFTYFVISL